MLVSKEFLWGSAELCGGRLGSAQACIGRALWRAHSSWDWLWLGLGPLAQVDQQGGYLGKVLPELSFGTWKDLGKLDTVEGSQIGRAGMNEAWRRNSSLNCCTIALLL